jgi:hypothetical protein
LSGASSWICGDGLIARLGDLYMTSIGAEPFIPRRQPDRSASGDVEMPIPLKAQNGTATMQSAKRLPGGALVVAASFHRTQS